MTDSALHLRDDQLLLYAGGELQGSAAESAAEHLSACDACRLRLGQLEGTLAEYTQAQHGAASSELPSAVGPRALLKAQMAGNLAPEKSQREGSHRAGWNVSQLLQSWRGAAIFASLALLVVLAGSRIHRTAVDSNVAFAGLTEEPNARFTPGAVIATARSQVCGESTESPLAIPAAMKSRVLQLYGVAGSASDAYEVDYLITPELGGATDIRNLWPEPYDHTVWNAHVKDRLENRLREMVCHGDIDLSTAQRDISTDWIAAYRKYFHAQTPNERGSS